ncbi:MAG: DUF3471 domain-containing protein [Melioribacteraceae bacterium]
MEWQTIIIKKIFRKILTAHTAINAGPGKEIDGTHFVAAGLGWFFYDYSGRKVIAHGGGLIGFISQITFIPEDKIGIIVLTNDDARVSSARVSSAIVKKVTDLFLNEKNTDYVEIEFQKKIKKEEKLKFTKEKRDSLRQKETAPSLQLEKYVGVYNDKMYGDAEINFTDNKLTLTLLPTKILFISEMKHWHFDTFRIKFNDDFLPEGFVTFSFDSNANIKSFKIDLPNPDFHFYNLEFEKKD